MSKAQGGTATPSDTKIAAVYCRVSTSRQELGMSLDMQRELGYLAKPGLTVRHYDDGGGLSGSHTNRPQYRKLFDDIIAGKVAQVIVSEQSRLARDDFGEDWGEFAKLCFVKDVILTTPQGDVDFANSDDQLFAGLRNLLGAYERRTILRRTAIGKDDMMAELPYVTARSRSYGYRFEPRRSPKGKIHEALVVDEDQAAIVREIFELYLGGEGAPGIANTLNARGVPYYAQKDVTSGGKVVHKGDVCQWTQAAIYHILDNELLTGLWTWGRNRRSQYTKDRDLTIRILPDLQIVERHTFNAAQEMRKERAARGPRVVNAGGGRRYAFSGVLKCAECGGSLVRSGKAGARSSEIVWRCKTTHDPLLTRQCRSNIRLHDDDAHALVWPFLWTILRAMRGPYEEALRQSFRNDRRAELEQELAGLDLREDHLLDLVESQGTSPKIEDRRRMVAAERQRVRNEIEQIVRQADQDQAVAEMLHRLDMSRPDDLVALPADLQNQLLTGFFDAIIIEALPGRGRRGERSYRLKGFKLFSDDVIIPIEAMAEGLVFLSPPPLP